MSLRLVVASLAALLAVALVVAGAPAVLADPAQPSRLAGTDRFETATTVSQALPTRPTPRVYIANGRGFPDGLSGGAAAAHDGSPLLLVESSRVPAATAAEIARLRPQQITVLGGQDAVSESVVRTLENHARVNRWSGPDRYATSAAISRETTSTGVSTLYVASGQTYPDALTGGAVAGAQDSSVLLVTSDGVPAAVRAELERLRPERIVVLGGTASVGNDVVTALRDFGHAVVRVHGLDRYATSAHLAQQVFNSGANTVYLASGEDFPDALAGAPAAEVDGAPVLLLSSTRIPRVVQGEIARLAPDRVVALGGAAAISTTTLREAAHLAGADPAALPGDGNKIMATPSATQAHLQRRAVAMGANELFAEEMIPALYRVAERYGIDPTVMIAQSFHETAGGHFGRAVTPAHHNTCGLKVRDPGGLPDDHPDAHARFPTWAVGATAHAQHLYAYAGIALPPGEENVDPRWDWVYGRHAMTLMTELGGHWAPSAVYGHQVHSTALRLLEG